MEGFISEGLITWKEKHFETSHSSADQNMFPIYWFLIFIIITCKLQNIKINQIHLERGLYLGKLIIRGKGAYYGSLCMQAAV